MQFTKIARPVDTFFSVCLYFFLSLCFFTIIPPAHHRVNVVKSFKIRVKIEQI